MKYNNITYRGAKTTIAKLVENNVNERHMQKPTLNIVYRGVPAVIER